MEHGRTVQDVILFKIKKEVKMKVNGNLHSLFIPARLTELLNGRCFGVACPRVSS